ncbi:PHRF1 protein, partial [Odontophorus gujanensis]|nr:PHRF1 protein [Odontophorus gujanensis]
MAAEDPWTCPVCCDVRRDIACVIPCNHTFCLGCIHRWARLNDTCPLCRTTMKSIPVLLRGNKFMECIVSPPTLPVPISFSTINGPRGTATAAEQRNVEAARVGGLLPAQWAVLFRERRDLLWPVLPLLEELFSHTQQIRPWQISALQNMIQVLLCLVGLNRAALVQVAAELPAAPSPRERERPGDEPGPETAGPPGQGRSRGPSARGRGGQRSAGGPRRPRKRRAASAQRAPQPCKRRPPRRL